MTKQVTISNMHLLVRNGGYTLHTCALPTCKENAPIFRLDTEAYPPVYVSLDEWTKTSLPDPPVEFDVVREISLTGMSEREV